jgi:Domain of unknown function (DUF6438)
VLCLALLATASCGRKKAPPADSVSIDQPHPPDLMAGTTLLATLERTGCYGECPVYRLTVSTDGSVVYFGARWVKVLGRREYKLSQAQVSDLESAFERANFMSLRDYDHVESTDDDWAHVSFLWGGRLKRVRHYHGDNAAPPALSVLEDELDRITDSGRFVGVAATSGASPAIPMPTPATPSAADAGKPAAPGRPSSSAKPSETAGPPDESPADPDNHP